METSHRRPPLGEIVPAIRPPSSSFAPEFVTLPHERQARQERRHDAPPARHQPITPAPAALHVPVKEERSKSASSPCTAPGRDFCRRTHRRSTSRRGLISEFGVVAAAERVTCLRRDVVVSTSKTCRAAPTMRRRFFAHADKSMCSFAGTNKTICRGPPAAWQAPHAAPASAHNALLASLGSATSETAAARSPAVPASTAAAKPVNRILPATATSRTCSSWAQAILGVALATQPGSLRSLGANLVERRRFAPESGVGWPSPPPRVPQLAWASAQKYEGGDFQGGNTRGRLVDAMPAKGNHGKKAAGKGARAGTPEAAQEICVESASG